MTNTLGHYDRDLVMVVLSFIVQARLAGANLKVVWAELSIGSFASN
jgi:hypothetical protein